MAPLHSENHAEFTPERPLAHTMRDDPGPGPLTVELSVAAWQRAQAQLANDPDLEDDENALKSALNADPRAVPPDRLLRRVTHGLNIALLRTAESEELVKMYRARQVRYAKRAIALRTLLFDLMQIFELRTFRAPDGTVSIKQGVQGVLITDEGAIPDEYVTITRTANKRLILDDLRAGAEIDGCSLTNGAPTVALRRSRASAEELDALGTADDLVVEDA